MKKSNLGLLALLFLINNVFSQTLQLTNLSQEIYCTSIDDSLQVSLDYKNIPANSNIVFYQSTNSNFNPYLNQGDSIGYINIGGTTSTNNQITTTCPEIIGIFIDACDQGGVLREVDNEYVVMTSGNSGFNVTNLKLKLPNSAINISSINSCTFSTPSATTMTTLRNGTCNASNLFAAGNGDFIPANAIVIIFTGRGTVFNYNFSSYCSSGQPIYILQNSCSPGTANFANNAPASCPGVYRTTTITVGSCSDALTYDPCSLLAYDASNPNAGDGNYVVHLPNTDTSSVTNGGIRNNASDKCNGLNFDSINNTGVRIIKFASSSVVGPFGTACNSGYHYIKAITHPNGSQPISNTIQYKLICVDINAITANPTICSGQNAIINNNSTDANATFSWTVSSGTNITGASAGSGNQINQILNNTSTIKDSVTYTITSKDETCTKSQQVKIVVNPTIKKPNIGSDTAICGTISIPISTGNNTTNWTLNNNPLANNVASITATQAGSYIASITGVCGNVADTIVITQSSTQPKPNLGKDTSFCGAVSMTLSTGIVNSVWFRNNIQINTGVSSININQIGTYHVVVSGTCGSANDTIIVSQTSAPTKPNLGNDTVFCGNVSKALSTTVAANWTRNNISVATNTTSYTATDTGTYIAIITNSCGSVSDTMRITQTGVITKPNLGRDTTICGAISITLSSGNATSVWFKDGVQIATNQANITVTQPGTYKVSITGTCSTVADTIIINQNNTLTKPFIGNDTTYCGTFSSVLSAGNNTAVWSRNTIIINTAPSITINQDGEYIATIQNACNIVADTINIFSKPSPIFELGNNVEFCDSTTLKINTNQSTNFWKINWNTGDTTISIIINIGGVYSVTVKDTNNCSRTDSLLTTLNCDYDTYLPTAFSPNGDNINDVLVPLSSIKGIEIVDFIIFDRWSEKIFESKNFSPNDATKGWNGMYKGENAATDQYAYFYMIKLSDGKIKTYKGTIALIR